MNPDTVLLTIQEAKTAAEYSAKEQASVARLLSVNVGLPGDVTWNGKTVRTAIWKDL